MPEAQAGPSLINQSKLWHKIKEKAFKDITFLSLGKESLFQLTNLHLTLKAKHMAYKLGRSDFLTSTREG